jgi:hypothetical protein
MRRLNLQDSLLLQGSKFVTSKKGNALIGLLRPSIGRSEDTTSATTTKQQQQ